MTDYPVFRQICELLNASAARYRVMEHPPEGKSDLIAANRGTHPGQGAKAMLCTFRDASAKPVLAVIPGNRKVDFCKIDNVVGQRKATLVPPDFDAAVTKCTMGAVPPFVFDESIRLVVDPALFDGNHEIAFNAGRLDRSIVMNASDYLRIANPLVADITQHLTPR